MKNRVVEEMGKLILKDFVLNENNVEFVWNYDLNKIQKLTSQDQEMPTSIYFTEESANRFMEFVDANEISKEDFFNAYNITFGHLRK